MLLSTLAGKAPTDLTTIRIGKPLPLLNILPNNINSLGDSSVEVVPGDVEGDRVPTLVSPNRSHTSHINDNYCVGPTPILVKSVQFDLNFQKTVFSKTLNPVSLWTAYSDVCCLVVSHVPIVLSHGPPQKNGVSPGQCLSKIKHVKGVSCVSPCLSAPTAPNASNAVAGQSVGGRLQKFCHIWQKMGANPRVVSVLRDGYTLPFKQRPLLTRSPLVLSGCANPTKSLFLKEALLNLIEKLVVEKVVVRSSLAFYNRLFLVPKPNRNGGQSWV